MKRLFFPLITSIMITCNALAQPEISFTFDDGLTGDQPGYNFREWNGMLLNKLDSAGVQAAFFVTGSNKLDEKGRFLLESWDGRGHLIANHTYTHPYFNAENYTLHEFKEEISRTDSVIRNYEHYTKMFRFPYLKEGDTPEKQEGIRNFLEETGYRNGYVTIDASDWYIDSRLRKRLKTNPDADISGFRKYYLDHLYDRAQFYEQLSYKLHGRHIKHTLLLHHNLASALFVEDLARMFRKKGWKIVSAGEAYTDPVYRQIPRYAGESLIYAQAKDTGRFEEILRYPAEDGRYEKEKMDELGL